MTIVLIVFEPLKTFLIAWMGSQEILMKSSRHCSQMRTSWMHFWNLLRKTLQVSILWWFQILWQEWKRCEVFFVFFLNQQLTVYSGWLIHPKRRRSKTMLLWRLLEMKHPARKGGPGLLAQDHQKDQGVKWNQKKNQMTNRYLTVHVNHGINIKFSFMWIILYNLAATELGK